MNKINRKDKHLRVDALIIEVMDKLAEIEKKTKVVVYEDALKYFIRKKKDNLIELGVSQDSILKLLAS